ncbi:A/G-specific adenine glycosylase [Jeotgalibaca caeni]|uniref:A/G-specific adenine glycosylase n=1 Tax=Jeotgalibaca caeni TaxID=3028623 RepID=UPI00237E05B3|nr:A/G-specific adenine glycosylase [Jeotgalibaca caeni]MDE1548184.1 A/G-specific adenine glycosylase [Jeotgalibaca caeni]
MNREEMKQELLTKYGIEMWPEEKIVAFRQALLDWFDAEGRDHLPWRMNNDPYRIWVSEIMLQQTRVVTVIPYYNRFMTLFPSIQQLADAEEEPLLKAWEGLGYYSRVRNIQKAAQQIVAEYNGVFPNDPAEIIKLKGIGPYTAGAIASMAFNLPEPAVDGNVMRVFSRLFEIGEDIAKPATRKLFELLVRIVIDPERPGDFNQAIMDLGTDICGPVNPRPEESPIKEFNAAYKNGTMHLYPFKSKAKKPVPLTMQGIVIRKGDQFLLEKRPENGLLANFWTFPLFEEDWGDKQLDLLVAEEAAPDFTKIEKVVKEKTGVAPTNVQAAVGSFSHVFSHRKWNVTVHLVEVPNEHHAVAENMQWVNRSDFSEFAFAVPQQKMWEIIKKQQRNFFNSF